MMRYTFSFVQVHIVTDSSDDPWIQAIQNRGMVMLLNLELLASTIMLMLFREVFCDISELAFCTPLHGQVFFFATFST